MKKAFTILELIIVIIIVGVLATIAFVQYRAAIENARRAEAKTVLSTLRSAQIAFNSQYPYNYGTISQIGVSAPADCNQSTNYFYYSCYAEDNGTITAGTCCATRCTSGGKTPPAAAEEGYSICLPIHEPFYETYQTGYGG